MSGIINSVGSRSGIIGIVTMPNQPRFFTTGTSYTQATNSYTKIIPATIEFDIGNNYSSGTFTAPVNGYYEFEFWGLIYSVTAAGVFSMEYRKDGSRSGTKDVQGSAPGGYHFAVSGSVIQYLTTNQYVELWLSAPTGAAFTHQWNMSGKLLG